MLIGKTLIFLLQIVLGFRSGMNRQLFQSWYLLTNKLSLNVKMHKKFQMALQASMSFIEFFPNPFRVFV